MAAPIVHVAPGHLAPAGGAFPFVVPMGTERNKLFISVIEAKELPAADIGGTSDPYVTIKEAKSGLEGKGKTNVVKKTLSPHWNQSFEFNFNTKLQRICFKVWDHDAVGHDDELGKAYYDLARLYDGQEHDEWLPLHGKGSHGTLHIKARAQWNIPVAWPGQWLPPIMVQHFALGLGWDFSKKKTPIDLDASVIAMNTANQPIDTISFKKLIGLNGAIHHRGDNRTGEGKGDDEQIHFDLAKMPPEVEKIALAVNVFGGQPLSSVKSAYCRLADAQHTLAFCRCSNLGDKTGIFFGYMVKFNGLWYFQALVTPVNGRTVDQSLPEIVQIMQKFRLQLGILCGGRTATRVFAFELHPW